MLCRVLMGASPSQILSMEMLAVAANQRMSLDTRRVSDSLVLFKEEK